MPQIKWTDAMKIGIPEIDEQHEHLTGVIAKLYDAHAQGRDKEVLQDIINDVHEYVHYHFDAEQAYMEKNQYPGLDDHVEQHEDFILKSVDHLMAFADGKEDLSQDVLDYLTDWWVNHVNKTDREMARCVLEK